jgi:hypothetical protein
LKHFAALFGVEPEAQRRGIDQSLVTIQQRFPTGGIMFQARKD